MATESGVEWFDRPGSEPVELHEHSTEWAARADEWLGVIRGALPALDTRVEHVGSTAVPGLIAKPVIDLLVSVPELADERTYRPALESLGLVLRAREPDHLFFRPPAAHPRTVHVHVCATGSAWEREHLAFRDQLRARADIAAAYAELKVRLAVEFRSERAAYTDGKAAFIRSVLDFTDTAS
jgi:GrpB-like predicted nucleotidyltransferase (UPF0157 family)